MEQMIAVIFDNEKNAGTVKAALRQIASEGGITVYGGALILKQAGSISVRDFDDFGLGTAVGSLIALLATPKGLLTGTRSFAVRAPFDDDDLDGARVSRHFVEEVSAALTRDSFAILAEIDADWITPLITEIRSVGGLVFRCPLRPLRDGALEAKIETMKVIVTQLQDDLSFHRGTSDSAAERRIRELQATINALESRANARRDLYEARQRAKRESLEKHAAAASQ